MLLLMRGAKAKLTKKILASFKIYVGNTFFLSNLLLNLFFVYFGSFNYPRRIRPIVLELLFFH
jgi:hypothetical protein